MTADQLRTIFPNASEQFIRANASDPPRRPLPDAKSQRDKAPTLGRPIQGEAQSLQRTRVRFTGFRVKPLDPDNFAGSVKDLLDGLRHSSLIPGDELWRITLETEQVKVGHYCDERTEILIERLT